MTGEVVNRARRGAAVRPMAVVAIALVALAVSCRAGDVIGQGDALRPVAGRLTVGGQFPRPPGTRVGFLLLPLRNVSDEPVELVKIELGGRGFGRTVRVVKVEVSPNVGGIHAIPGGAYVTDPPVIMLEDGRCHSAVLRPVRETVIQPGATARVWVVLEWGEPGRFLVGPHEVFYLRDGVLQRQTFEVFYRGVVDPEADPARIEDWERSCLSRTSLLNPQASS